MRALAQLFVVLGALLIGSGAAQHQAVAPDEAQDQPEQFPGVPCSDRWEWANPHPTGSYLNGVSFQPERGFVAVGEFGDVVTSPDGDEWVLRSAGVDGDLTDVACNAERCLAVCSYPEGILDSSDGATWHWHALPGARSIATDSHNWVLTTNTQILRSVDGEKWEPPGGFPYLGSFSRVVWSNDEFLVLDTRYDRVLRSRDGATWTGILLPPGASASLPAGAASNGRVLVVVGSGGAHTIGDSRVWSTFKGTACDCSLANVVWTGSEFIAVGTRSSHGCSYGQTFASPDGYTWTQRSDEGWTSGDLVWTGERLVAVTAYGQIYSSTDGAQWDRTSQDLGLPFWYDVAWDGRQFIAVGSGGIYSSADGRAWTKNDGTPLRAVCSMDSGLAAVGDQGTILTSNDGQTWARRDPGSMADLKTVAWSGRELLAAGYTPAPLGPAPKPEVLISTDGNTWQKVTVADGTMPFERIVWTGSEFLAGGYGQISASTDGRTWITGKVEYPTTYPSVPSLPLVWKAIASNGTTSIAVGRFCEGTLCGGLQATMTAGTSWKCGESWLPCDPYNLYWGGKHFLLLGSIARGYRGGRSLLLASSDGSSWAGGAIKQRVALNAFATNREVSVAVGNEGTILRNDCWASLPVRRHLSSSR